MLVSLSYGWLGYLTFLCVCACVSLSLCLFVSVRFMICCDQCEEWFHGDCVGITVSMGKRMERAGKDYVCPVCIERGKLEKEERAANR